MYTNMPNESGIPKTAEECEGVSKYIKGLEKSAVIPCPLNDYYSCVV
jgi:hypothetical protein